MSVTILSTVKTHCPAFNNMNIVASSTNSGQTNFKYVVTIQINDGLYNPDTSLKIPKRPDNSKLYFNPNRIAENYISTGFSTTANDFFVPNQDVNAAYKKVTIGIDEEYGSPVSGFGGVSATYFIWNGAYDNIDFADFTYSTTTKAKDLTLVPSLTDTISFNQRYLYKTWHRGFSTNNLRNLNINAYNSAGTLIQTTVLLNQFYDAAALTYRNYVTANVSPYGLNNTAATIVSQLNPGDGIIPLLTTQYTMYFDDGAGPPNVSSNTYTVNIDDFCSKYTRYVLHFLNKLGNWDSFTFNLLSRNTTDKEESLYKKIPYSLVSNEYTYTKDVKDTVIYNTILTNKWTMNSDWVSDAQATWLRDLFASPDIKLEIPADPEAAANAYVISVKCKLKTYETKKTVNDKFFNFFIEIENDLQDVRQRG